MGSACCAKQESNSIIDSYSTGSVTVVGDSPSNLGGLVGANGASVQRSYATGNVNSDSSTKTGGLVGFAAWDLGSINQSFASGSVNAGAGSRVGGLVGLVLDVSVAQSYATGNVSGGANSVAGGLAGQNGGGCSPCSASISEA